MNSVKLESPMIYAKFQDHLTFDSEEYFNVFSISEFHIHIWLS